MEGPPQSPMSQHRVVSPSGVGRHTAMETGQLGRICGAERQRGIVVWLFDKNPSQML